MNGSVMGRYAAFAVLILGLVANGCKSAPKPVTPVRGPEQGTLNPDGTFTPNAVQQGQQGTGNADGTSSAVGAAQGPPQQAPAASSTMGQGSTASSTGMAPAPAPAPPAPRTIAAGTSIAVTITESLSASHNNVGDSFSGVLAQGISAGGRPAFARGTRVEGTVVAAKGRGRFKGAGALGIELTSIAGERVNTSEYEKESKGRGKRSAGFIGGGAGLGALIGGLAGGGKGAAIGALAGGGGGTAAAAYTGDRDVVIPSESTVTFRLTSAIRVK